MESVISRAESRGTTVAISDGVCRIVATTPDGLAATVADVCRMRNTSYRYSLRLRQFNASPDEAISALPVSEIVISDSNVDSGLAKWITATNTIREIKFDKCVISGDLSGLRARVLRLTKCTATSSALHNLLRHEFDDMYLVGIDKLSFANAEAIQSKYVFVSSSELSVQFCAVLANSKAIDEVDLHFDRIADQCVVARLLENGVLALSIMGGEIDPGYIPADWRSYPIRELQVSEWANDELLKRVATSTSLENLEFHYARIPDSGYVALRDLRTLKRLLIVGTEMESSALIHVIEQLPTLSILCTDIAVSDDLAKLCVSRGIELQEFGVFYAKSFQWGDYARLVEAGEKGGS